MKRTVIIGYARAGKTTMAKRLAEQSKRPVLHLDDLLQSHGHSELSQVAAQRMRDTKPWIIEGVQGPRALRKALRMMAGKPCDEVVWLRGSRTELSGHQIAQGKGHDTVMRKILPELLQRGVEVRTEDVDESE